MQSAIQELIDGYKKFRTHFFAGDSTLYGTLVRYGQKPKTIVIACSDSRVDPALIFNCQPGDLFVIRNVANLVPPCESSDSYHGTTAALEFAIRVLEISHIIILGHTQCGGIQTLMEHSSPMLEQDSKSFIAKWMELARPAHDLVASTYAGRPVAEQATLCGQYALANSLANLTTFPWIADRQAAGHITLHGWYFDLATGAMHVSQQDSNQWTTL